MIHMMTMRQLVRHHAQQPVHRKEVVRRAGIGRVEVDGVDAVGNDRVGGDGVGSRTAEDEFNDLRGGGRDWCRRLMG